MIYITGDTHGEFNRIEKFCNHHNTTTSDVMIIMGDAGINYYLDERDIKLKKYLSELPITLFCIHGNHEQRPEEIDTYKKVLWNQINGICYVEAEYPTLKFGIDGECYEFDGKHCMVIGGAYSVDKYYRWVNGYAWWDNEQPNEKTKAKVEKKLNSINYKVDIMLTHTVPIKYEPTEAFLPFINQDTVDKSTEIWLDSIEEKLSYQKWYAGHYHIDKTVDKMRLLFNDILAF